MLRYLTRITFKIKMNHIHSWERRFTSIYTFQVQLNFFNVIYSSQVIKRKTPLSFTLRHFIQIILNVAFLFLKDIFFKQLLMQKKALSTDTIFREGFAASVSRKTSNSKWLLSPTQDWLKSKLNSGTTFVLWNNEFNPSL